MDPRLSELFEVVVFSGPGCELGVVELEGVIKAVLLTIELEFVEIKLELVNAEPALVPTKTDVDSVLVELALTSIELVIVTKDDKVVPVPGSTLNDVISIGSVTVIVSAELSDVFMTDMVSVCTVPVVKPEGN